MNAPVRIPGEPVPIGDNSAPTPFDLCRDEIEALYMEAKNHLDGEPITTQAAAEGIGKLMDMLRQAHKKADEARITENKPFDDGKAEVQERYAPLISDTKKIKGKTVLALDACNKALAPFLAAQDAEKRRKEVEAREAARVASEAAAAAFQSSRFDDLTGREEAEQLATAAKAAEVAARRAEKDRATVKGGARAIGLRTTYRPEITDPTAFAKWVWLNHKSEMLGHLQAIAERHVTNGSRSMPGITVHEERKAQ